MSGMEGLIDMEEKGCELIIHGPDHDLWLTMVDVPDSGDRGDFRSQLAADISSFFKVLLSFMRPRSYRK